MVDIFSNIWKEKYTITHMKQPGVEPTRNFIIYNDWNVHSQPLRHQISIYIVAVIFKSYKNSIYMDV